MKIKWFLMERMGMLHLANQQMFYPVTPFISCEDGGFYIFTNPPCCCLVMKDILGLAHPIHPLQSVCVGINFLINSILWGLVLNRNTWF